MFKALRELPSKAYSDCCHKDPSEDVFYFSAAGGALLVSALVISLIVAIHGGAVGNYDPTGLAVAKWTAVAGGICQGIVFLYKIHKICSAGDFLTQVLNDLWEAYMAPFKSLKLCICGDPDSIGEFERL